MLCHNGYISSVDIRYVYDISLHKLITRVLQLRIPCSSLFFYFAALVSSESLNEISLVAVSCNFLVLNKKCVKKRS